MYYTMWVLRVSCCHYARLAVFRSAGLFYCRLKSCLLQKFWEIFKSGRNRVFQVSY